MDTDKVNQLFELSRGMYFRRDGTPYNDVMEWVKDFERGMELRRVAETTLWWGGYVSTIWLGLNHNYFGGPPIIFETMVFAPWGRGSDLAVRRYSTETQAFAGHVAMVRAWKFPLFKLFDHWFSEILWRVKLWARA